MRNACKTSCRTGRPDGEEEARAKHVPKPIAGGARSGDHRPDGDDDRVAEERDAVVYRLDKLGHPIPFAPARRVLDGETFGRLKSKSEVVTARERDAAARLYALDKERKEIEAEARKAELLKHNTYKTKGTRLAQFDEDAQKEINYKLNRSFELRQDQEDEIKICNSLILSAKCHAIRNAQIAEKELIQKQMREEERRLEELMEQARMLAGKKYAKAVEADQLKQKLQAMTIAEQIKENEINRELQIAREEEDARFRMEAAIEAQRAEVKDYKEKLIKQAEMRREFLQSNAQLIDMKKIANDLIEIELLQIQAHDKQKYEREKAFEEEIKKQKTLKDKEIAKIQANQKASYDLQAAKDELNAIRTLNKVEKEWRRKEHEEALRKINENEDLKEARKRQIEDRRISQAFEIQREKEEFEKIIRLNIKDMEKNKELEEQERKKIIEHRANLVKQINEKELEKIEERKQYFLEGLKHQEVDESRKKLLSSTVKKKIEGLKEHNLPEKYLHEIERRMKLTTGLGS